MNLCNKRTVPLLQGFNEPAGIKAIMTDSNDAYIYDIQSNRLDNVRKGVNIIRTRDGKTQKVVLK